MIKINSFQLALILITMLSVTIFVTLAPQYVKASGDLKHYEDSDISFNLPGDWEVLDYENRVWNLFLPTPSEFSLTPQVAAKSSGKTTYNTSRSTPNLENFRTKVTISKNKELKPGVTLADAYQMDDIYILMSNSPDFRFVSKTPLTINSLPAYEFIFEDHFYRYQDVWVEKNGKYYRILGETLTDSYDFQKTNFDTIVNSFRVK